MGRCKKPSEQEQLANLRTMLLPAREVRELENLLAISEQQRLEPREVRRGSSERSQQKRVQEENKHKICA